MLNGKPDARATSAKAMGTGRLTFLRKGISVAGKEISSKSIYVQASEFIVNWQNTARFAGG